MISRKIGYFFYDGMVLLEFAGPLQVFDVAGRVAVKRHLTDIHPFTPVVLSKTGSSVKTREGVFVGAQGSIASQESLNMVLVPGGALQEELSDAAVVQWLKRASAMSEITASVCVGSFLLGKAGLLDGREATTHFDDIADLRTLAPRGRISADKVWVDEGTVVTSGGFAAGIDMALHLVSRCLGEDLAAETARQLEYPRRQSGDRHY